MKRQIENPAGMRFGGWLVLEEVERSQPMGGYRRRRCRARCACGTEAVVFLENLTRGLSKSCGCVPVAALAAAARTHGKRYTAEWSIWSGMKNRCLNPAEPAYPRYGGRGITVCDRWRDSFEAFLADVGQRPSPEHSLDRIDNARGYEPGNVRWATRSEQARNTRRNRRVTLRGVTRTVSEWAPIVGLQRQTIEYRLAHGWSDEAALTTPVAPEASHPRRARAV